MHGGNSPSTSISTISGMCMRMPGMSLPGSLQLWVQVQDMTGCKAALRSVQNKASKPDARAGAAAHRWTQG